MKKAIYPDVHFQHWVDNENRLHLRASTSLRKRHEGKWYLTLFIERDTIKFNDPSKHSDVIFSFLSRLHKSVYNFNVLGVIQPDLQLSPYPDFAHELDSDKRSEEERLKEGLYIL